MPKQQQIQHILDQDNASKQLGICLLSACETSVVLDLTVTTEMTNGYALCHGGVIFSLADTALAFACIALGATAVTQSAQIDYINSAKLGDQLRATTQIMHWRKRNIVCDIQVHNQDQQLIALVRGKQLVINT
ncbi:MAG: hotdog fold thioesterase [Oceanospirillaceae bacterium]